ncbi:hypothetical protein FJY93_03180 [Candidatus Kaiserbacteria bacterium]|nr:hypothetical protein [Candidatus Kaiserbacteria bacterium]
MKRSLLAAIASGILLYLALPGWTKDFPRFDALLRSLDVIEDGSCEHVVVHNTPSGMYPTIRLYRGLETEDDYLMLQRFTYKGTDIFAVSSFTKTQSLGGKCREALIVFNMQTGSIEAASYMGCLTKGKWHVKDIYGEDTRGKLVGKKYLPAWEKRGDELLKQTESIIALCAKKK